MHSTSGRVTTLFLRWFIVLFVGPSVTPSVSWPYYLSPFYHLVRGTIGTAQSLGLSLTLPRSTFLLCHAKGSCPSGLQPTSGPSAPKSTKRTCTNKNDLYYNHMMNHEIPSSFIWENNSCAYNSVFTVLLQLWRSDCDH